MSPQKVTRKIIFIAAHTGVQGGAVGFGDTFQSGIRPVPLADGANHEGLATLLRADRDPIRHGTTQKVRHSIRVVCGLQFQPGALGVQFQQAVAFHAATYAWTGQLDQILQLVFVRRLDALKPR